MRSVEEFERAIHALEAHIERKRAEAVEHAIAGEQMCYWCRRWLPENRLTKSFLGFWCSDSLNCRRTEPFSS